MMTCSYSDGAGGNQQRTGQKNTANLDRETEELKRGFVKKLSSLFRVEVPSVDVEIE